MGKGRLIDMLDSVLREYKLIESADDLTQYVDRVDDPGSTLNQLAWHVESIIEKNLSREKMQGLFNRIKDLISDKAGQGFFSIQFDRFKIVGSPALNRIKVYGYIKGLIPFDKFEYCTSATDCLEIVKKDDSLFPDLQEHLQWQYRAKILTTCYYKLDPKKNKKYGPAKFLNPDPEERKLELDLERCITRAVLQNYPYDDLYESFIEHYNRQLETIGRQFTESELSAIFDRYIQAFPPDKLEFFLTDILSYIKKQREEIKPNTAEIWNRKKDYISRGEEIPVIVTYFADNDNLIDEEEDDLEKLFPEIYGQLNHLYVFHDFLVDRIRANSEKAKSVPIIMEHLPVKIPLIKQIIFTDKDTIVSLYDGLEIFFPEHQNELKDVLDGKKIQQKLIFPSHVNQFVDVFRKCKDNRLITNDMTEIRDWLCANFQFKYKRGNIEEIRDLNPSTVWDQLRGARGVPTKKSRLPQFDWLY